MNSKELTRRYSTIGLITAMLLMFSWTGMGWNALGITPPFLDRREEREGEREAYPDSYVDHSEDPEMKKNGNYDSG